MIDGKHDHHRVLHAPSDAIQADAIARYLDDHGIACEVRSYHETAFDGLFTAQKGWGVIRVRDADHERAKSLLDEWLNAEPVAESLVESAPGPTEDSDQPQPSQARRVRPSMTRVALLLSLLGNVALLLFGFDGWLRRGEGHAGKIDARSLESVQKHMLLPTECSEYREWYAGEFVSGMAIAEAWAKDRAYGKASLQRVDRIEVVLTRAALDARINELGRIAGKPLKAPADTPAALEEGVLVVVDLNELLRLQAKKPALPEEWHQLVAIAITHAIQEAHAAALPRRSDRKRRPMPPWPRYW
jgi:hypothetical protein